MHFSRLRKLSAVSVFLLPLLLIAGASSAAESPIYQHACLAADFEQTVSLPSAFFEGLEGFFREEKRTFLSSDDEEESNVSLGKFPGLQYTLELSTGGTKEKLSPTGPYTGIAALGTLIYRACSPRPSLSPGTGSHAPASQSGVKMNFRADPSLRTPPRVSWILHLSA